MPDQEIITPNLASTVAQGGVADAMAGSTYSGIADSSTAGEIAFGGPTADFILYRVVNGSFIQPPPDQAAPIEPVNNPLPYWYGPVQVSGGAITATYVSGGAVTMTLNAGAAADEAYFEQIVPVSWYWGNYIWADWDLTAPGGNPDVYVSVQYLDSAGATTGTPVERTDDTAGSAIRTVANNAESSAAVFARIRFGIRRDAAAASDAATVTFVSIRDLGGPVYVPAVDNTTPETYTPGTMSQTGGVLDIGPTGQGATDPQISLVSDAAGDPKIYISAPQTALTGAVQYTGVINPTVSGTVDDWAPAGGSTCTIINVNCNAGARIINGIDATPSGEPAWAEGQHIYITGTSQLTFAQAAGTSASGNRIGCPGAVSYVAPANYVTQIIYLPSFSAANPFRIVGTVV